METPQPPEGLRHCVVSTDELVVVVPPNHEWARQSRAVSALELAQTSAADSTARLHMLGIGHK